MKKITYHISGCFRIIIVLTILFSIIANGAFAGQRIDKAEKDNAVSIKEAKLIQGPPSPDDMPQNMETSNLPATEQQAYLKAPQILNTDNSQSRFKLNKEKSKLFLKEFLNSHTGKTLISTTSMVHSNLGRLFRLVGAKPSGTS